MLKVVIVEENGELAGLILELFRIQGYYGYVVADNHQAYRLFIAYSIDVIFLKDQLSATPVCITLKKIRDINKRIPVVVMGRPVDTSDIIMALSLGADNYICHFRPLELLAYFSALIRFLFSAHKKRSVYILSDCSFLNVDIQQLKVNDNYFRLSWQECVLLENLAAHKEKIVSSEELIRECWMEVNADTKTYLSKAIMRLRKLLVHDQTLIIEVIRGRGYMLMECFDSLTKRQ